MPKSYPASLVPEIVRRIDATADGVMLSWKQVLDLAKDAAGFSVSRQYVATKREVAEARERHNLVGSAKPVTSPLQAAQRTIQDLRSQIVERDRKLASYDDLMVRHLYWLHRRGIRHEEVERAIVPKRR